MIRKIKQKKSIDNVDIFIDNDPLMGYEKISCCRTIFNFCVIFFLQMFPGIVSNFVVIKSSRKSAEVHKHRTTHKALDLLYCNNGRLSGKRFLKDIVDHLWFNLNNPKSVRNRLKLVKKLLKQSINLKINQGKKKIVIFSLASGSARAVIETVSKFPNTEIFEIFLLDKNPDALKISRQIVENKKLTNVKVYFINDNVRNFDKYIKQSKPDIIEMVGLLDYLDEEKTGLILKKINDKLSDDGVFITANIRNNSERKFLEKAINWHMVYREPNDLSRVLVKAGFHPEKINLYYEPLMIHGIGVTSK